MALSRTYLDSYYLLAIILGDRHKSEVRDVLYRLSKFGLGIIIPQTVLGETVARLVRRSDVAVIMTRLEKLGVFLTKYDIDLDTCLPSPGRDALRIANDLMRADPRLDGTDIIIISHVLADPHSKFFLTYDAKLLDNIVIEKYEKCDDGLRVEKLEIMTTI